MAISNRTQSLIKAMEAIEIYIIIRDAAGREACRARAAAVISLFWER